MKQEKQGGFVMRFEERKFCRVRTLAERWDCSTRRIYDLISKNIVRPWHPEGQAGKKGMMIEVASVLEAEKNGMIEY